MMGGLLGGYGYNSPEQRTGNSYKNSSEKYGQPFYFNRVGGIVSKKSDQEKIRIQAKTHKEALFVFKQQKENFDNIWVEQNC
jgi:hypothetical protein